MSDYRDSYLWLLATQIPIATGNCSSHDRKPLLDALCEACGSDWEGVAPGQHNKTLTRSKSNYSEDNVALAN